MQYSVVTADGRVRRSGTCQAEVFDAIPREPGDTVIALALDSELTYLRDGIVTARPSLAVSDGAAAIGVPTIVASGLPVGTRVFKGGLLAGTVDDGTIELESNVADVISFRLIPPFPYRPAEFRVTVA